MSEVTGPISTLPNSRHDMPAGTKCDDHVDRPAVARIQGETDSFGSEMHDMCQECLDKHRKYLASDEAMERRIGICEWCSEPAEDLRDAGDYDEGMCGRLYRVCGACIRRVNEEAAAELEEMETYDFRDDCFDYDEDDL